MKRVWAVATSLAVMLAAAGCLAGDAGTRSPFDFGAGASDLARAGAVTTRADAATAVYWNPALLVRADRLSLTGFHSGLYGDGVAYQYAGAAVPTMDLGTFGVGIFRLGVDGIERRDAGNLHLGGFGESRLAIYAGYGRSVSAYDLGLAVSLEHHSLDDESATSSPGVALGIGRQVGTGLWWLPGASVGFNARNVVRPGMKLDGETVRYPRAVDAGVAIDLVPGRKWDQAITVSAALTAVSRLDPALAFGVEYRLEDRLRLGAGLRDGKACFGAGLTWRAISFDYALVDRDLGSIHTFSISAGLGASTTEKRRSRDEAREAQFNQLLQDRLAARNREAVAGLVAQADDLAAAGDLERAVAVLDRALVVAGDAGSGQAGGPDAAAAAGTADVYARARDLRARLEVELAGAAAAAYSDSAEARMAARDYLGARYFAELALARVPDSAGARDLLARANSAIEQGSTEGLVFESRLRMADSLLSYGKYEEALAVARAIGDVAPENDRARLMVTKAEFNYWQDAARRAFSRGDLGRARGAVDSALVRFPGQPACVSLRSQIDREIEAVRSEARRVEAASPAPVGAATKDVEEAYRSGQGLFKSGHLADAVSQWEKVEALAPGYQSVRTYLVNAYKYLGVELYTQNHLQEAVDVWRKAAKLAPDSAEIANYIRRTEGEMARLKELSYERR